jgi:hypothetical protein
MALNEYLSKLTSVRKGDSIRKVASSERMNAIQESLRILARGDNIQIGENLRKKTFTNSVMLSANRQRSRAGGEDIETPFQVITRTDSDGNVQLGVISNSHLFNSEDKDTYEEENSAWGLLSDDLLTGWFDAASLALGDKIWLEIELNQADQSINAINIRHGSVGPASLWDEYPDPISINIDDPTDPYQEFYNQIIAEITDPEQDPRPGFTINLGTPEAPNLAQVTQLLFTDLMMTTGHTTEDADEPNLPVLVVIPWNWPGTATDGTADEINSGDDTMTPFALGKSFQGETPFQVVRVPKSDLVGVVSNSHLFNSEDRDTYEEDNNDWGLLSDDLTSGGFAIGLGEKIWLEIELSAEDQSVTNIQVNHGSAWDDYPDPIFINTDDPNKPYHQFYRQIIAEVTNPNEDPRPGFTIGTGDAAIQVTQLLFTSLMMTTAHTTDDADEPGVGLLVAIPWNSPGTDTGGAADEIPSTGDMMTPWQLGTNETGNHYSFEMINASDSEGAKVLIYDGQVFGPSDDGNFPEGMPSDDTYILPISADGNEVWLIISVDNQFDLNVQSVSIDQGTTTPEDDDTTIYITLGAIDVDYSGAIPVCSPTNFVCGDYILRPTPPTNRYSFQLLDASDNEGAKVRIFDGQLFGPNDDGYPSGMPSGDDYILGIGGDGFEVWVGYTYDDSSGLITSRFIDQGPSTPDNKAGTAYVTLGAVGVDTSSAIPVCKPTNFQCGDIIIGMLPTDGLDTSKRWVWMFDPTTDGNQKWVDLCPG